MTDILIFASGVFISLITIVGFAFTVAEFKNMGQHPESYPKDFSHLRPGSEESTTPRE